MDNSELRTFVEEEGGYVLMGVDDIVKATGLTRPAAVARLKKHIAGSMTDKELVKETDFNFHSIRFSDKPRMNINDISSPTKYDLMYSNR